MPNMPLVSTVARAVDHRIVAHIPGRVIMATRSLTTIRSFTLPGDRPKLTVNGVVLACRPRPSGKKRREAPMGGCTPGAILLMEIW